MQPKRWSQEEIIEVAQHWTHAHGRPPRSLDWHKAVDDDCRPTAQGVVDAFATWNAMLTAAGLPIAHRAWSREETLAALAAWINTHGRPPTGADWAGGGGQPPHPTSSWVHVCFGSWNAMLLAGGVQPNFRFWSREDILATCAEFQARLGRPVRAKDFHDKDNGLPSIATVRRTIGSNRVLLDALNRAPSKT